MTTLQELLARVHAQMPAKARKRAEHLTAGEQTEHLWCEVYTRTAYVYRFWHTTCSCGATDLGLEGVYEERRHPRLQDLIMRKMSLGQIEQMDPATPRKNVVHCERVPRCFDCLTFNHATLMEMIHAQTKITHAEGEVAPSGAPGTGRAGEDPPA